ncbi:MAG: DUF3800 domain-containing protein [Candidatus Micrarchaeia archaeon]
MAKRDFLFIDEAGDPGIFSKGGSRYYIMGLIHLTDESIKEINIHLEAFRYFGHIKRELISTRLNKLQKEQILKIFEMAKLNNYFIKASAIYLDKEKYQGPYLEKPTTANPEVIFISRENINRFRNLMVRKLLEFHFSYIEPQSREIEIVIDRFYSSEEQEQKLRNYLRTDKYNKIPDFLHIIQADSRYVELLQIADYVSGIIKEKFFVHPDRNYEDFIKFINVKEILR